MRHLNHDNVLTLHEVYESPNSIYLVLDLLEGGELFDRLTYKGDYSEYDCMMVMQKIFRALSYMHEKNIMHRDLKPENIILAEKDDDYNIQIADFGLASRVDSSDFLHKRCGTPGYCAPEILTLKETGEMYDQKCDIFSIGCIFYQL